MPTDTSERGLEDLIVRAMTGHSELLSPPASPEGGPVAGGTGWILGDPAHYNREFAVDLVQLRTFVAGTQPELLESLSLATEGPTQRKFLDRLAKEVTKRGVVDLLRRGLQHDTRQGNGSLTLFYASPTPGNAKASALYAQNRFSVTRQLRYSTEQKGLALDLGLFVNGLPIATFELKNSLTKQTVDDAIEQYKVDRDPRELLFLLGRCIAHFAVDDHEVRFCTQLTGKGSWFLPFNKGWDDGAGNPPNPFGLKTAYLWEQTLTPPSLTNIIENYAQLVEVKSERTNKKTHRQVFPRYHQINVVRELLADAAEKGAGQRYLVQHSAGSGKSNSIAWLAHQLVGLRRHDKPVFDTIIVITDRKILDRQIHATIKSFLQVGATVGHADHSSDLRRMLSGGMKVIISTVQKFPHIVDDIGSAHRDRTFAILIDEAHSSQGGKTAGKLAEALALDGAAVPGESSEDLVNRVMEARKMLPNASYFAFTATPKNKTLEMFGVPLPPVDGRIRHRPFHSYTMKQAIEEGFILDVLKSYTPIQSYYKLKAKIEADPEFDKKKAQKKLRKYVEGHPTAIRIKAEIMVDHFHDQVLALNKIGGQARAMVVCSGIERAIQYFKAFSTYLSERKSQYGAIVAFSGEFEFEGVKVTEASLNGFASNVIAEKIVEEPYRFLICADKFQTGYDEPLLHTMYVDKVLSGIQAVQTLSRLNRAHPQKQDVFVLDFTNTAEDIQEAFKAYYRTTFLADETDPNKLNDLKAALDAAGVYQNDDLVRFVDRFLAGADRNEIDVILNAHAAIYKADLDEDGQVDFKGKAKAFCRTYSFLSSILPYSRIDWERLSIFLYHLIDKLPSPKEDDLTKGMLQAIDMDSYRAEKRAAVKIALADEDGEIEPVPVSGGGRVPEPELERLSAILKAFNDLWGKLEWKDKDRVGKMLSEDIPRLVAADVPYQNARAQGDEQNAKIEHDKALRRVLLALMKDDMEVFKLWSGNDGFKRWLSDSVFEATYRPGAAASVKKDEAVAPRLSPP